MRELFETSKDVLLSTQFLTSFFSTTVSHVFVSKINLLFNYHEEIDELKSIFSKGLEASKIHKYQEAAQLFKIALEDYEKIFFSGKRFDHKAQVFYIEICYNYTLSLTWLGEYDIALLSLKRLLRVLNVYHSSLQDPRIFKMIAVIYLKQGKLTAAGKYFDKCLDSDRNNQEFRTIRLYLSIKESKYEEKEKEAKSKFILESKLFNLNLLDPFHFELNCVYLQMLAEEKRAESQKDLNDLIEKYERELIFLPYEDQVRLEQLSQDNYQKMPDHPETKERIAASERKLSFKKPKAYPISLLDKKPLKFAAFAANEFIIYREGWNWYSQLNNNEMTKQSIPEEKLLKILKIKRLDQIPKSKHVYYLSYAQKALLHEGLSKYNSEQQLLQQQHSKKSLLSRNQNLLVYSSMGLTAVTLLGSAIYKHRYGHS